MEVINYALERAVKDEGHQAISSLLAIGADPNAMANAEGRRIASPLIIAVYYCNIEIVKVLLQAGGEVINPDIFSAAVRLKKPIEMF